MDDVYPARSPATASRVVDGEAVIIQPDKGTVNVLNSVGSRIWELSDGKRALEEIAQAIAAEYQVTLEEASADARAFVDDLVREGMLLAWEGNTSLTTGDDNGLALPQDEG